MLQEIRYCKALLVKIHSFKLVRKNNVVCRGISHGNLAAFSCLGINKQRNSHWNSSFAFCPRHLTACCPIWVRTFNSFGYICQFMAWVQTPEAIICRQKIVPNINIESWKSYRATRVSISWDAWDFKVQLTLLFLKSIKESLYGFERKLVRHVNTSRNKVLLIKTHPYRFGGKKNVVSITLLQRNQSWKPCCLQLFGHK